MKMVTINGKEVKNPVAAFLIGSTVIVLVLCLIVLITTMFFVLAPLLIIGIGLGVLVEYGNKKRKN